MGKSFADLFADQSDNIPVGSPRDTMINLIARALKAEAGIRYRADLKRSTNYYAGRRAGFVCAAATVAALQLGADYEAATHVISRSVKRAGDDLPASHLSDAHKAGELANEIVSAALSEA